MSTLFGERDIYSYFLTHIVFPLKEMYNKIETDDEGDISMKLIVEHILAVEAGSGSNAWVGMLDSENIMIMSFR